MGNMGNRYERAKKLSNTKFKRIIGIKRKTFDEMALILAVAFAEKHKSGGRNPKLTIEEKLLLALEYWRQYVTLAELGFDYGVAESMSSTLAKRTFASVTKLLFTRGFPFDFPVRFNFNRAFGNISDKFVEQSNTFMGVVIGQ